MEEDLGLEEFLFEELENSDIPRLHQFLVEMDNQVEARNSEEIFDDPVDDILANAVAGVASFGEFTVNSIRRLLYQLRSSSRENVSELTSKAAATMRSLNTRLEYVEAASRASLTRGIDGVVQNRRVVGVQARLAKRRSRSAIGQFAGVIRAFLSRIAASIATILSSLALPQLVSEWTIELGLAGILTVGYTFHNSGLTSLPSAP